MIINYKRGNLNLMIDIDKIDFISSEKVEGKAPVRYDVAIGLNTGREIDLRLDHYDTHNLLNILGEFMKTRKDYMDAAKPFLDKEIRDMDLSMLAIKACEALGVKTLGDLVKHNRQEVLAINQIGKKTLTELDELLEQHMLWWGYKQ